LLKTYKPRSIGIYGCSAGGILTGQVVARLQLRGLPLPGAVGMFCAAPTDHDKRGDSTMWGVAGIPAPPASVPGMESVAYMKGVDPRDPTAYPSASDAVLARFPPTLLLSGTRSADMSPAIVAHARFLKLGVDSSLYLIEGGWHGAHVSAVDTPEQHDAAAYIAHWFDQKVAK
jgi:acetyl esterase/lipase